LCEFINNVIFAIPYSWFNIVSDDFRETACINILKLISSQYSLGNCLEEINNNEESPQDEKDPPSTPKTEESKEETAEPSVMCSNPECTRSRPGNNSGNVCQHVQPQPPVEKPKTPAG